MEDLAHRSGRRSRQLSLNSGGEKNMDSQTLLIIGVIVVLAALGAGVWMYYRSHRSRRLKSQFGPEYDRTVERLRNRDAAEAELQQRQQRVERYRIVALSPGECSLYQERWKAVQSRFVDDPSDAVKQASDLINEVMKKRGYPVSTFEEAAADLSVDHPDVVSNYRAASRIAENNRRHAAKTEELRQALVYYRALFTELLEAPDGGRDKRGSASKAGRRESQATKPNGGGLRT
jgi:hypothetical protein